MLRQNSAELLTLLGHLAVSLTQLSQVEWHRNHCYVTFSGAIERIFDEAMAESMLKILKTLILFKGTIEPNPHSL
jgi:hypothetical protein